MQKMIAVGVDDSIYSANAITYAASMAKVIPELSITLLHIQPQVSRYLIDEAMKSLKAENKLNKLVKKNSEAANVMLEAYREQLIRLGIPEQRVSVRTQPQVAGTADDIMAICQALSFDAVLVGRRGLGYLHGLILGSLTANIVCHSQLIPVWVVDGQIRSNDIVLAIDGSSRSLRALDHLAFMLSSSGAVKINMIHIRPKLRDFCEVNLSGTVNPVADNLLLDNNQKCLDDFYSQVVTVLESNGFSRQSFDLNIVSNKLFAGKAICEAARQGGFGTVVVGKRGTAKSLHFGSISRYVLQKIENQAVWIVP
ncbi:MAG: universal stress protein [Desulfobacteraceae bacterium]|nr:universal stress protein [Desulfobacteraceae bacterium]